MYNKIKIPPEDPKMTSQTDESRSPALNGDEVRAALQRYDRSPFLDVLMDWLRNAPSGDAISLMSQKNPFMWAQALTGLAKLAGFTDKRELEITGRLDLHSMSDSELQTQLAAKVAALGLPIPLTIDGDLAAAAPTETHENPAVAARRSGPKRKTPLPRE